MSNVRHAPTTLDELKLQAKQLKRESGCTSRQSLDITARNLGYTDFGDAWWRILESEYQQRVMQEARQRLGLGQGGPA